MTNKEYGHCIICGKEFVIVLKDQETCHSNECVEKWSKETRHTRPLKSALLISPIRKELPEGEEWKEILRLYDYRCAACGSKERLERDHIVPSSAGGSGDTINVQPLCKQCNLEKRANITMGWKDRRVVTSKSEGRKERQTSKKVIG